MKVKTALSAIIAVLLVHIFGMIFEWYFLWKNMDVLMHFLGGLVIGMLAIALIRNETHSGSNRLIFVIGFVALVGVIWEFQEYFVEYYRLIPSRVWEELTLKDTLADLMNDLVGGIFAYILWPGSK